MPCWYSGYFYMYQANIVLGKNNFAKITQNTILWYSHLSTLIDSTYKSSHRASHTLSHLDGIRHNSILAEIITAQLY